MQSCERASLVCSNYFQTRTHSRARDRRACVTNSSIVEAIRNSIITAVLELDRARDLRCTVTSLVRLASAAPGKKKFHGDEEHDHSPSVSRFTRPWGSHRPAQADHRASNPHGVCVVRGA